MARPTTTTPGKPSVGFVEVQGLSASLVVADVAVKAANVRIAGIEANALGGMGIKLLGRTADVERAVRAGCEIARQMNALVGENAWAHYSDEAQFLIHCDQSYNGILENNEHLLPPDRASDAKDAGSAGERPGALSMAAPAIGLIETQGLVGLIEAADAMCKAASVRIIGREKIGAAYVTVMVEGDVAAVKAAIDAGAQAVERVGGKLILAHVIARPHDELAVLLPKPG